jgi:penicillin-binding protein-related factor A (putative recombinase)
MKEPKKNIQKESKAQITFSQYLRKSQMRGFFELKVAKGKTLPFSAIEEHQYEGLQATQRDGLVWKLSDEDRRKKPCDSLSIPPLPSYLVIKFDNDFYIIQIHKIVNLKDRGSVSISLDECKKLADKVIHT